MDNVDYEGATILHFASAHGYIELTRYLLSQGTVETTIGKIIWSDRDRYHCDTISPRDTETPVPKVSQCYKCLFWPIKGVSVNIQDRDGWTPLHTATYWMQPEVM